jgi:hypothetical protein
MDIPNQMLGVPWMALPPLALPPLEGYWMAACGIYMFLISVAFSLKGGRRFRQHLGQGVSFALSPILLASSPKLLEGGRRTVWL